MDINDINPELMDFLQTLPPDVREQLIRDMITKKSKLDTTRGRPAIITPGDEGSYVIPRQGPMPVPALLQAFENKRTAKSIEGTDMSELLNALKNNYRAKSIMSEDLE